MSSFEEIQRLDKDIAQIWSLITKACIHEAKEMVEHMLRTIQTYREVNTVNGQPLLETFAHAYHVAGYTASMSVRNSEAFVALQYFREMKHIAADLHNDTLFIIALTYEGDTYRRLGNLQNALACLQKAYDHTPQPDLAARGNCAQLLGRIHFSLKDLSLFEKMMGEAEQIGHGINQIDNSLHGQYCLGTVYIDYARSYNQLGQTQKSLDYLQLAESVMPSSPHWKTLLTATKGILLVRTGDIQKGMPHIVEAVKLGHEHGNQRLLDRLYALRRFFDEKAREINEARSVLDDALDEYIEF